MIFSRTWTGNLWTWAQAGCGY